MPKELQTPLEGAVVAFADFHLASLRERDLSALAETKAAGNVTIHD